MSSSGGSFAFTNVPAGEYILSRSYGQMQGRLLLSHPTVVNLKPRETLTIEYANPGRKVIGKAVPSTPGLPVDWQADHHAIVLKNTSAPFPDPTDFPTRAGLMSEYYKASARVQSENARRNKSYALLFEKDGTFQIDDVPAGDYELKIQLTRNGHSLRLPDSYEGESIGELFMDVQVPPGRGPFDIGVVQVRATSPSFSEILDFSASRLNGDPFRLHCDYRSGGPSDLSRTEPSRCKSFSQNLFDALIPAPLVLQQNRCSIQVSFWPKPFRAE